MMMNFKLEKEKCIKCKLCASDCPVLIIDGKTEYPEIKEGKEENCIKCQHCLAVCPTGAISIWDKKPENSISIPVQNPKSDELENLMQTRRSIRKFRNEDVDTTLIHRLISIASYAPTAKNENAVRFTVVDNQQEMLKLRETVYNQIKKALVKNSLPPSKSYLINFSEVWEAKQIDVIFRDAPHLLIASAPRNSSAPIVDSTIAMTYFDLLANSNGLGTLWCGFAKDVFEDAVPQLKTALGIPEDHLVTSVLLFGKPAVKYARSIQNDGLNIFVAKL